MRMKVEVVGVSGVKRGDNRRTSTSIGKSLTLASEEGYTSRGAVTINGSKLFMDGEVPSK
jgi:hypothetical protein